jgi:hypothetical protein
MVGTYQEPDYPNTTHSYLCTGGHFVDTDPGNDGHQNGSEILADQMDDRYIKDGSTFVPLDHPDAVPTTQPNGINDTGVIVGSYGDSSYQLHGLILHLLV